MTKIHVPDALGMLEKALDDLTGTDGSGARISAESNKDGALGKFAALAMAISKASSAGGTRPGTTTPAWARPSTAAAPVVAPVASKLEKYEQLQSSGKSREAGQFYSDNADEIHRESCERNQRGREEFRQESEAQRRKGY